MGEIRVSEAFNETEELALPGTGTLGTDLPDDVFDGGAERDRLTALAREHRGNDSALRAAVLERLKALNSLARSRAEILLVEAGDGRMCARMLSDFQDALIELIYDFTVWNVYRATNPSDAEKMSVIATGGYGRSLLAPGSDVDLLFLLPYKQTAWGESVIEYMLYILWDMGFKVGHATRTTDQSVKLAHEDMTIRTSLLDARLIFGDASLFDDMVSRLRAEVFEGTGKEFIAAKLEEQDVRHERAGTSRYRVEPNIKDGKGGLRDLHTLHWLTRHLYDEEPSEALVRAGIFSEKEYRTFDRCEGFLWTIRCHLHFLTLRAEEKLTFDVQPNMAERLNYAEGRGMAAVERFMKHYFLVAKDVGDLTRILCAGLELQELKEAPGLRQRLLKPLGLGTRDENEKLQHGFELRNGRIAAQDPTLFEKDPIAMVRLFEVAEELDVAFHPDVMREVRANLHNVTQDVRENGEANALFLDLLCSKDSPEAALRKMNEVGLLGRFIPEFGQIVCMMQFNMYHHFTVDEHLIQAVGVLSEIEQGEHEENLPLSTEIFPRIANRRALFVAVLLHDIAKGRDEDHSIAGMKVAKELCPRFGLTDAETELVAWLIEFHLEMSNIAQTRDINDPKTIQTFLDLVQTQERLDLLLLLTVADIRAVGPGVWNGWKGALLRSLYYATLGELNAQDDQPQSVVDLKKIARDLAVAAPELTPEEISTFIDRNYPSYWLRTETETHAEHARLTSKIAPEDAPLETSFRTDAFNDITELTLVAPNHPNLLAMTTGACTAAGADIAGAQISTTRDGLVLDTLLLQRAFDRSEDEERRATRIADTIKKLLRGELYLDQIMKDRTQTTGRDLDAFDVEPTVLIDNQASDDFTVVEIEALDRPGLLFDLTSALSVLNLEINSAFVTTFGEKAIDVFYVTDLFGKKIEDDERQQLIVIEISQMLRQTSTS